MEEMQNDEQPTTTKIVETIKSMKDGRAAGMDRIKIKIVKAGLERILERMEQLYKNGKEK